MSSIQMPRVLSQRGKTQLEIEREHFEKEQAASIQKAVNSQECPVKEKHVRIAIIGTHREKSGMLFWHIISRLPLQDHPIVSWKFCHVLHKVLREGHLQVLQDSQRFCGYIKDLGKLWGHLKDGYGRLIAFYTKLLLQKLSFHKKYPQIGGNMMMDDEELDKLCEHDVNNYFELCVDMLDYMDDILSLQTQVFGSLDMSRSNSMTSTGQCRLAPLIQCIQDSCQLYDQIVKILFRLHSSLPADTLGGHRDRFNKQYKSLKQFYYSSGNLQYFKNLIKVPSLPDNPPNFLRASDLNSHVAPVAIIPDPEPEPLAQTPDDSADLLIDTSSVCAEDLPQFTDMFGQNGAPSPPVPDDRDRLIEQLMREINELKEQLARVRAEDFAMIESLQNRIRELESELSEMKQIAESTQEENESLRNCLKEQEQNADVSAQVASVEKMARANEDKFKKMKDIYTQLRGEHVALLRKNAEVKKIMEQEKRSRVEMEQKQKTVEQELNVLKQEKSHMECNLVQTEASTAAQLATVEKHKEILEKEREKMDEQLTSLESAKSALEDSLTKCQQDIASLQRDLDNSARDRETTESRLHQQMADHTKEFLVKAVEEGQTIIRDSMSLFDDPHHNTVSCTAEYMLHRSEPVLKSITRLKESCNQYSTDSAAVGDVVKDVCDFSHHLADLILNGKATANAAPIEQGDELTAKCKSAGDESLSLLELIKDGTLGDIPGQADKVVEFIRSMMVQAEELVPKVEDVQAEQMGDLIDQEMQQTSNAIEQAAARIADMLAESRQAHTGIQLEVNEKILDSCNSLMAAIKVLVEKSKHLQREIAASQGRGTGSSKEFYKRHHRWTEGLISAAKAVGWGANVLVEGADKVVKGDGKFEELVVCSQEIAASTTQLVVASKVKADRKSPNLQQLSDASKGVTQATAAVMASAKAASQMIDDMDTMDFSKLTLHQAKRHEMDSQVKVLELESELEKERVKLAELRKKHYQLAGESEGWEVDNEEPHD